MQAGDKGVEVVDEDLELQFKNIVVIYSAATRRRQRSCMPPFVYGSPAE